MLWKNDNKDKQENKVVTFLVTLFCHNCMNFFDWRFPKGTDVRATAKTMICPICGFTGKVSN